MLIGKLVEAKIWQIGNPQPELTISEMNLTRDEIIWLKSLKKRIDSGQLVVAQTDKSKKFAIITQEQYVASGLVHTKKDLEISPH